MNSNKGIIVSSLLMQMILVPVLMTVILIGVAPYFHISTSGLGKDAYNLIQSVVIIAASLIIGGATAFFYLRLSEKKISTYTTSYITALIPLIYAFAFAVVIAILSGFDFTSDLWAIYIFKNPMFLIVDFILSFGGLNFLIPITELMGYLGYAIVFYLYGKVFSAEEDRVKAKKNKVIFAALCIAIAAFSGISMQDTIGYGMIELRYGKATIKNELTEYDLSQISPFRENNGLAKLDKEASLRFEDLETMPRLDGATAAYPVYAAFVEAVYKGLEEYLYENKDDPEKQIYIFDAFISSDRYPISIVKCSKTNIAYKRLIRGEADIIFVAEPSKAQIEVVRSKGDDFIMTPIGYEAFVFFTNKKNPVQELSVQQVQDIYSGRITNWKAVGGHNAAILPFQRPEDSGSQTIMQNKVMKDIKMIEPTMETEVGGMGGIISRVAEYKNAKNAIGYSFMYYSSTMIKNNQIKYLGINGVMPSSESIRNKTYPFTVPVYAVTLKSNKNDNVNRFIDWILSGEGQQLIQETGYIPVK